MTGASEYQVQISGSKSAVEGSSTVNTELLLENVSGTSFTLASARPNPQRYYWHVRAVDGMGKAGKCGGRHGKGREME